VSHAVIAAPAGLEQRFASLAPAGLELDVVTGGASRGESVARGLDAVGSELVAVHDAARPLITPELIDAVCARLVDHPEAAGVIAAAPITDTVKRVEGDAIVATEDRDRLWAAQTPQAFRTAALRDAHAGGPQTAATDDAMLVERAGGSVLIEPAPPENLKVTTAVDLRVAEMLLARN
jgi:2-C-methyl-D-erythritol 4-phosphate cytidylyltransferase